MRQHGGGQIFKTAVIFVQHIQQQLGHVGVGAGHPHVGRRHRGDLHAGGMDIVVGFVLRQAVAHQAFGNNVIVENGRMGAPSGEDLAGKVQASVGHAFCPAQAHAGVHQADVIDDLHAHISQFVFHNMAVPVPAAHHVAAGQAVGHTHVDLNGKAIQQQLGKFFCNGAALAVTLVIGPQVTVRVTRLEQLVVQAERIQRQAVSDEIRRLHRLVKALRRLCRHLAADPRQLQQFFPPLWFGGLRLFFGSRRVMFGMHDHRFHAAFAGQVEGLLLLFAVGKVTVHHIHQTQKAFFQQQVVINGHVGILPEAAGAPQVVGYRKKNVVPFLLLLRGKGIDTVAHDQLLLGNGGSQVGKGMVKRLRILLKIRSGRVRSIIFIKKVVKFIPADHRLQRLQAQTFHSLHNVSLLFGSHLHYSAKCGISIAEKYTPGI